jgi:hypothetical protein
MSERMTPEETAEFIFKRMFNRDKAVGGHSLEITGIPGSGKTSLNLHFHDIIAENYPSELMFWRDLVEAPAQFTRAKKWQVFVENGVNFQVRDKNDGGRRIDVPHQIFETVPHVSYNPQIQEDVEKFKENQDKKQLQDDIFGGIYKQAKGSMLNVIYFSAESHWIDFMRYVRNTPEWVTLFWDEYEDIFPGANRGELWWRVEWAKNNIKQTRKGFVNVFANTQTRGDVDWRIRGKMGSWAYLFGALPDDDSPIRKKYARHLRLGQGWLDLGHYKFGKFKFDPYKVTDEMWEVRLS